MECSSAFRIAGLRAFYRPKGAVSTGELADMITSALELARARASREVVINIVGVTGFESPGPAYRRWVVRRWAKVANKQLRVVVVARREHICPEKTGLIVAAEEGLEANIFTGEAEAVGWLNSFGKLNKPTKKRGASKSAWPVHPWS